MAAPPRTTAFAAVLTIVASLLAGCAGTDAPAAVAVVTPGPAHARYVVDLRESEGGTRWSGTMRIAFTNTTGATLDRVWLRLWANGVAGCAPRAVRITDVVGGRVVETRRECTAVAVELARPLAAGERTDLGFDLRVAVPERNDRFGVHRGVALLGGALPVLAVLDASGWHLDPYVDLGESFFSLVSRYEVRLDHARHLETSATGVLVRQRSRGDRVIQTYRSANVRDFAWAVGPLERLVGRSEDGIRVQVWHSPEIVTRRQAARVLTASIAAMDTFETTFGDYPYREVDVVTSAFTTFGGMEYPTIVFSNPDRATVSHELAHQWWWGVVGNDQFAEPWLDESLATWSMFLPTSPWRNCAGYDWPSATARITNDMAYWGDHPDEYPTVYGGGGCMFAALAHEIGTARLVRALGDYAEAHRLGVASGGDLVAELEIAAAEVAPGLDMAAFWDDWRVG